MPRQSSSSMVLDFATVYQCGVKPFKSLAQNRSVCILLNDQGYDGSLSLSDAVCSNYISGRRAIPDDCRAKLAKITEDDIKRKLNALNIFTLERPADALRKLIDYVQLPNGTRNRLVKLYDASTQSSTPSEFLAEVFRCAADATGSHPLSAQEQALLASFASSPEPTATDPTSFGGVGVGYPDPDCEFSDEDLSWMREHISPAIRINQQSFFRTPVTIKRYRLTFPSDTAPLLYLLKPALKEVQFESFSLDEFEKCIGISFATGVLQSGELQCLRITGSVDSVVDAICSHNLKDVCAAVMLFTGQFTSEEARLIEDAIKEASYPNVSFLRSLIFDKQLPDEVILIVNINRDQAKMMQEDFAKKDGDIRIYKAKNPA